MELDVEAGLRAAWTSGDSDGFFCGIKSDDLRTEAAGRFAEKTAAASDVERVQSFEGASGALGSRPKWAAVQFANERRVCAGFRSMQRLEIAFRIPPAVGDSREPGDFFGEVGAGLRRYLFSGQVSLQRKPVVEALLPHGTFMNIKSRAAQLKTLL